MPMCFLDASSTSRTVKLRRGARLAPRGVVATTDARSWNASLSGELMNIDALFSLTEVNFKA